MTLEDELYKRTIIGCKVCKVLNIKNKYDRIKVYETIRSAK